MDIYRASKSSTPPFDEPLASKLPEIKRPHTELVKFRLVGRRFFMVRWPRERPFEPRRTGRRRRLVPCPSALRPSRLASLAPQDEGPPLEFEKVGTSSDGYRFDCGEEPPLLAASVFVAGPEAMVGPEGRDEFSVIRALGSQPFARIATHIRAASQGEIVATCADPSPLEGEGGPKGRMRGRAEGASKERTGSASRRDP